MRRRVSFEGEKVASRTVDNLVWNASILIHTYIHTFIFSLIHTCTYIPMPQIVGGIGGGGVNATLYDEDHEDKAYYQYDTPPYIHTYALVNKIYETYILSCTVLTIYLSLLNYICKQYVCMYVHSGTANKVSSLGWSSTLLSAVGRGTASSPSKKKGL